MIRLAVRVARADAETALDALLVLSPAGLEEVDLDDDTVEFVLYGASGDLPAVDQLKASVGSVLVTVTESEIPDDWEQRWRAFHVPAVVAERLYVRAPWHPPPAHERLIDVAIEPGQAFGTGAHATTRLCLELLVALEQAGEARGALLDVGCGSGVLAIAAAKLGFAPVLALDNDAAGVAATSANAAANGVELDVRGLDLLSDALPAADTVVANLLLAPLLALAERLDRQPQRLIASGLLDGQADELAHAMHERQGLREAERRGEGEWLAILFEAADPRVSS